MLSRPRDSYLLDRCRSGSIFAGALCGSREVAKLEQTREILVVEDDRAIRRLLKMVLQREGYRVQEAADGVEAVLKIGVAEYDVIVLDLMMPNLDGFAFMSTLADNDARLKKIIVTSAASRSVIEGRMRGTPFDTVSKPFDLKDLVARVRACITAQTE
jgi:two-component system, OmpR family, response regulator ResD